MIDDSRDCKLGSLMDFVDCFFILKIFTKFSVCLTESFFSIIFFVTKIALSKPTKILAWPDDIFLV